MAKKPKKAKNNTAEKNTLRETGGKEGALYDRLIFLLLAFTIFFIPLYLNIQAHDQFELPKLTALRIITAVMLGLWLAKTARTGKFEYKPTPLDIPLAGWIIMNIVTTFTSPAPHLSLRGEYENFAGSLTNINYAVLYFIASQFIKTKKQVITVNSALLFSGFLVTVYAIFQFFGYDFINWSDTTIIKSRYFASMGNPNFLGALLIMILPVNISFLIINISRYIREKAPFSLSLTVILSLLFTAIFAALLGTQSRGPALGAFSALLIFAVYAFFYLSGIIKKEGGGIKNLYKNNKKIITVFLIIITASLAVLTALGATAKGRASINRLTASIADIQGSLKQSRLHIWVPALKIIKAHPVTGTGADTFKAVFPQYEGVEFAKIDGANVSSRTAHNEPLNIAATMGLVSLGIYILLIVSYILLWRRSFARLDNMTDRILSLGIFAGAAAYLVQNFFSFGVAAINTIFYIFMAMHAFEYMESNKTKIRTYRIYSPRKNIFMKYCLYTAAAGLSVFSAYKAHTVLEADKHYNRGTLLGSIHSRWDLAVREHKEAVKLAPGEVKYRIYLGLAFERYAMTVQNDPPQQEKMLKNAAEHYKRGIELNPLNAYYRGNLGRVYSLLARLTNDGSYYEKAVKHYKEAVKKAPVTGLFYHNLMETYVRMGRVEKAEPLLEKIKAYDKKLAPHAAFVMGNIYFSRYNSSGERSFLLKASEFYSEAIALDPGFTRAHFNFGVVSAALGNSFNAVSAMEKVLAIDPDFPNKTEALRIIKDMKEKQR
ncbi:MAG: O-antigen ligase family protein [Candidatus Goldiibacteriota bacterium]